MKNPFIKKIVIIILVFAAADIAVLSGSFWVAGRINSTEAAIKKFVASSENKSFRTEELRAALDKIRQTREEVENYETHLFQTGEELNLIKDLEKIAEKNQVGLQIVNSNLDHIVDNKINMNLLINGRYADTINYLLDLEAHNYFLSIESVTLAPNVKPDQYTNEDSIRLNILLTVYAG